MKLRQNRRTLLNERYEQLGIGAVEDEKDFFLTMILAEDFLPSRQFQQEIESYKGDKTEFEILKKDKTELKEFNIQTNDAPENSEGQQQIQGVESPPMEKKEEDKINVLSRKS